MRKLAFVLLLAAACGKNPGTGDDTMSPDADMTGSNTGTAAFEITSTDLVVPHGTGNEVTKCFYFHTSNTTDVAIDKWVSHMTPGSHHMIMFLNPGGSQPADGTIDDQCGVGAGNISQGAPVWTYATQTADQTQLLPTDDGAGKPLAQKIPPHTAGYLQMHYLNATDADITVHVDLKAYALDAATAYTQTDAYVTYNNDISIPANAVGFKVSATCNVPTGAKFWTMSTHAHKQEVRTEVMDATSLVFESGLNATTNPNSDWEHPGVKDWSAPQFFTFASNKLTWSCTYDNTGDNKNTTVVAGQSAQTNEMCMATGYYFPAQGPKFNVQYNGNCISL